MSSVAKDPGVFKYLTFQRQRHKLSAPTVINWVKYNTFTSYLNCKKEFNIQQIKYRKYHSYTLGYNPFTKKHLIVKQQNPKE